MRLAHAISSKMSELASRLNKPIASSRVIAPPANTLRPKSAILNCLPSGRLSLIHRSLVRGRVFARQHDEIGEHNPVECHCQTAPLQTQADWRGCSVL